MTASSDLCCRLITGTELDTNL
uniref:Uncharacterized protein n=1 Tax=Arundo donax TaxID=35708 RepID=A0A0A9C0F1_ARUDO